MFSPQARRRCMDASSSTVALSFSTSTNDRNAACSSRFNVCALTSTHAADVTVRVSRSFPHVPALDDAAGAARWLGSQPAFAIQVRLYKPRKHAQFRGNRSGVLRKVFRRALRRLDRVQALQLPISCGTFCSSENHTGMLLGQGTCPTPGFLRVTCRGLVSPPLARFVSCA